MEHIEQCIAELRALEGVLGEKNKEIETLRSQGPKEANDRVLRRQSEEIRKYKAENKALKESLRLITEKRKQDRQIIAKWQQVLQEYKDKIYNQEQRTDIPTDETRLESSPPHRSATSLTMESIEEKLDQDEDEDEDEEEAGDITLVKVEAKGDDTGIEVVEGTSAELRDVAFHVPVDVSTPPAARLTSAHDDLRAKRPRIQVSLDSLLARDWHPSDFMINPDMNAGITHAYHEKVLGKARAHLDCSDCASCKKFQNLTGKKLETSSRHREVWRKQDTPPGFWRSGFDTAAESLDRHLAEDTTRAEALERLGQAISSGKYLFKDAELRELAKKGLIA